MDKALRVRLEDAEQILSDVSIKCCEVLNLISVHGVTDAHREALHIAARVVYLAELGRKKFARVCKIQTPANAVRSLPNQTSHLGHHRPALQGCPTPGIQ